MSKTQDKTEIKLELSARRAELAAMHTRPALSMVKYVALSQEIARLEGLLEEQAEELAPIAIGTTPAGVEWICYPKDNDTRETLEARAEIMRANFARYNKPAKAKGANVTRANVKALLTELTHAHGDEAARRGIIAGIHADANGATLARKVAAGAELKQYSAQPFTTYAGRRLTKTTRANIESHPATTTAARLSVDYTLAPSRTSRKMTTANYGQETLTAKDTTRRELLDTLAAL